MKRLLVILLMLCGVQGRPQGNSEITTGNLADEVAKLKEVIKGLQENEIQSEKIKYLRNYQLVLYGIEIVKEIRQGTIEKQILSLWKPVTQSPRKLFQRLTCKWLHILSSTIN